VRQEAGTVEGLGEKQWQGEQVGVRDKRGIPLPRAAADGDNNNNNANNG
jgi:hypothetical protein